MINFNVDDVRKEIQSKLDRRNEIMVDLLNNNIISEPIYEPLYQEDMDMTELASAYQEVTARNLVDEPLLVIDIELVELYLNLENIINLTRVARMRTKYSIDEWSNYYAMLTNKNITLFKIALCEVLEIDASDYRHELDAVNNDLVSFKDILEEN